MTQLRFCLLACICFCWHLVPAQENHSQFSVLALYTAKNDPAHISFVQEANQWFERMSMEHSFAFESSNDWQYLNDKKLDTYDVVIFLDTRPEDIQQRQAFERYMNNGGAWIGFHFAAFALNDSAYPDNWPWYQNDFLGCGAYQGNTWKPTPALLRAESSAHAHHKGITTNVDLCTK